jgi:hypothetical protein
LRHARHGSGQQTHKREETDKEAICAGRSHAVLSLLLAAASRPAAMVFSYSDGLNLSRELVAPAATERNKAVREMGTNNVRPKMPWKTRLNGRCRAGEISEGQFCSRGGHKWGKGDHFRPVSETLFSWNPMPLIQLLRRHNFAFRRAEPESDREIAQPDYDRFNKLSNSTFV